MIIAMPANSRRETPCLKRRRVTICAKITSTSPKVRTRAAVSTAKARNQNWEAKAPMKPAKSEGRHAASTDFSRALSKIAR